ncbi:MAG: ABC transporter ATP-binding protein [Candidatus Methanoperedens sp.]|nr:ABC transporter ATP-binding protein [Candidatus Methanoperedens sp.]
MLKTECITKTFRDIVAVDNLNLHIRKGDIYGFLGPNGAGKTTTIGMLTGLINPTSGTAFINGLELSDIDSIKQIIGVYPQEANFYSNQSAQYHMLLYGFFKGLDKKKALVESERLLQLVGLNKSKNINVGNFSHGMKKRLGIAQALIGDPEILILDEITNGIDPLWAKQVRDLITELNKSGITIVISSHNLFEVQHICNRVGIIHRGRLVAEDDIDLIKNHIEAEIIITLGISNLSTEMVDWIEEKKEIRKVEKINDNKLLVYANSKNDTKPEIIRGLVSLGADIFELGEKSRSLEDVFIHLTK